MLTGYALDSKSAVEASFDFLPEGVLFPKALCVHHAFGERAKFLARKLTNYRFSFASLAGL